MSAVLRMNKYGGQLRKMGATNGREKFGSAFDMIIPTTREVLIEHLRAKVKCLVENAEEDDVLELVKDSTHEDILQLLCDCELLRNGIDNIVKNKSKLDTNQFSRSTTEQEELGECLFVKVARIDSELCAQITGMLLEMDTSDIKKLLNNPSDLAVAVAKAKMEFVKYVHDQQQKEGYEVATSSPLCNEQSNKDKSREIIGETLYKMIAEDYPDEASQITGNSGFSFLKKCMNWKLINK